MTTTTFPTPVRSDVPPEVRRDDAHAAVAVRLRHLGRLERLVHA